MARARGGKAAAKSAGSAQAKPVPAAAHKRPIEQYDHRDKQRLYVFDGVVRKYRPDFLIRLRGGRMLVLEVKGQESEQTSAKHGALDEWTRAVTAHGGFGEWTWAVARRPAEVADVIARSAHH